jgi:predicted dehydrogenase
VGACLEAGRPVLCEKPLATTADAARRVVEAEAASGRRLVQVGFMRRFDPGYVDMKRALDAGRIGRPLLAHSIHRNPAAPAWFDSELIVKDTCVHDVDSTRWLLGQEFVRATVHAPRPSGRAAAGLQDPLIVVLETDAGAVVTVEAFVNAGYAYDIRCEVVGEDGTVSAGRARKSGGASRIASPPHTPRNSRPGSRRSPAARPWARAPGTGTRRPPCAMRRTHRCARAPRPTSASGRGRTCTPAPERAATRNVRPGR